MIFYEASNSVIEYKTKTVTLSAHHSTQSVSTYTYTETDPHKKIIAVDVVSAGSHWGLIGMSVSERSVSLSAWVMNEGTYSCNVIIRYIEI